MVLHVAILSEGVKTAFSSTFQFLSIVPTFHFVLSVLANHSRSKSIKNFSMHVFEAFIADEEKSLIQFPTKSYEI